MEEREREKEKRLEGTFEKEKRVLDQKETRKWSDGKHRVFLKMNRNPKWKRRKCDDRERDGDLSRATASPAERRSRICSASPSQSDSLSPRLM